MSSETTKTYFSSLVGVLNQSEWSDSKFDSDWNGKEGKSPPLPSLPPLTVPAFQRFYEWPEEMVANFTTNLFDTFLRNRVEGAKDEVLVSTVFLHIEEHERDIDPYKDSRYRAYILDGQQRLVTLSLIILVLMDQLKEKTTVPVQGCDILVGQLRDILIFKLNTTNEFPRIALHVRQNEEWKDFLFTDDRKIFDKKSIFLKNYTAIEKAFDDCISEDIQQAERQGVSGISNRIRSHKTKELHEFAKSLLNNGLCKSVLLIRHGSLQLSLKLLTGINTPGRPLDIVSHIKFHLAKKRTNEDQKYSKDFLTKLDSSTPNSAVFVAACAILPKAKTAIVITDVLTIVKDALNSSSEEHSLRFFNDTDDGLNIEESYWSRAIPVAQYLEQMDDSSVNLDDRSIMPLLALSRIKSSKNSTSSKTLRLIQSLLVAAILSFGGKVNPTKGGLRVTNPHFLRSYFKILQTHLLWILVVKKQNVERVDHLLEFIETQLRLFRDGKSDDAKRNSETSKSKIEDLLLKLHNRNSPSRIQDDMMEAGLKFAVLLACQKPEDDERKWRFDGLHDFQLEHIAAQKAQKSKNEIPLSLIHCLGNYCMLEPEKNSSAGKKPFSEKKGGL